MSAALVVLAVFATVNPARLPLGLSETPPPRRLELLALGGAGAAAVFSVLLAVADALLEALDVSPESLRISFGIVLAVGGVRVLATPRPGTEPGLPGRGAAIVPVLFPLLLTPELALVAAGADERNAAALAGLAAGIVVGAAGTFVARTPVAQTVLAAAARLLGAVLVVAAVALVVDGIRDV